MDLYGQKLTDNIFSSCPAHKGSYYRLVPVIHPDTTFQLYLCPAKFNFGSDSYSTKLIISAWYLLRSHFTNLPMAGSILTSSKTFFQSSSHLSKIKLHENQSMSMILEILLQKVEKGNI